MMNDNMLWLYLRRLRMIGRINIFGTGPLLTERREKHILHIRFQYKDALSNWEWKEQECTVSSVDECIRVYGLNESDVEYEILEVKEV